MFKTIYLFFLLLISSFFIQITKAQDLHFSQFYANPIFINPGMTGTCLENRGIINFKSQWPQLAGEFTTFNFSWDFNVPNNNSNIGFISTLDKAGAAGIKSTHISLLYAYTLELNEDFILNAGLQGSYNNKSIDYLKLVFGDQLDASQGNTGNPTQEKRLDNNKTNYFDFSSGFVLFNKNFWFGVSAHHLNRPNLSFVANETRLPTKFSLQTGYKFELNNSAIIHPVIYYSNQGGFNQLDVAINGFYNPIFAGITFKGLPLKNTITTAISPSIGVKYNAFNFLYSYDYYLKGLNKITGGAHEISVLMNIHQEKNTKKSRRNRQVKFPSLIN